MQTGLVVRRRAGTFVQLPQPHRRRKHSEIVDRREIIRVKRNVADTHVVKVADPTVVGAVGNGTDQQRLVVDSKSVRPSLGRHVDAIGIDPDFAAIPDARDMMPLAIGKIRSTLHVIIVAVVGDAERCLTIVQLQLVAAGAGAINTAEVHVAGGLRRPNPRFEGESTLRIERRVILDSDPIAAVEPQRVHSER
jgi:hypothetical protein